VLTGNNFALSILARKKPLVYNCVENTVGCLIQQSMIAVC